MVTEVYYSFTDTPSDIISTADLNQMLLSYNLLEDNINEKTFMRIWMESICSRKASYRKQQIAPWKQLFELFLHVIDCLIDCAVFAAF